MITNRTFETRKTSYRSKFIFGGQLPPSFQARPTNYAGDSHSLTRQTTSRVIRRSRDHQPCATRKKGQRTLTIIPAWQCHVRPRDAHKQVYRAGKSFRRTAKRHRPNVGNIVNGRQRWSLSVAEYFQRFRSYFIYLAFLTIQNNARLRQDEKTGRCRNDSENMLLIRYSSSFCPLALLEWF